MLRESIVGGKLDEVGRLSCPGSRISPSGHIWDKLSSHSALNLVHMFILGEIVCSSS